MFADITLQLKKTNQLNLITKEITPAIPLTEIYYFKEINCNKVDISWSLQQNIPKFKHYFCYDLPRNYN